MLTIAAAAAVVAVIYALATLPPIPADSLPDDTRKWLLPLLPIYQQYSKIFLIILGAVGFAFVCLVLFLAINFIRADRVKILGLELQISEELSRLQQELADTIEQVISLQENSRELQDLIEEQSLFLGAPDKEKCFDFLDKIVETAAFVIRPGTRSVRASIWLYNKQADRLRIVAGYRIAYSTRRKFALNVDGAGVGSQGFVAHVLRSNRPVAASVPNLTPWVNDPDSTSSTTSIIGQPIEVGSTPAWNAVLCFSTDRDIAKFPRYAFAVKDDAATLRLFAGIVSSMLTLAQSYSVSHTSLIELIFKRYD